MNDRSNIKNFLDYNSNKALDKIVTELQKILSYDDNDDSDAIKQVANFQTHSINR